jgi:molybdopterin-binding protein
MPRKDQGWITFQLPDAERQLLEEYCQQTHRSKTDILRELVRNLDRSGGDRSPSQTPPKSSGKLEIQTMRVSARNVFPAQVKRVKLGSINAEIAIELAPGVEAISIITRSSAEALELTPGKLVYAVIKSSDVMVAVD